MARRLFAITLIIIGLLLAGCAAVSTPSPQPRRWTFVDGNTGELLLIVDGQCAVAYLPELIITCQTGEARHETLRLRSVPGVLYFASEQRTIIYYSMPITPSPENAYYYKVIYPLLLGDS